MHRRYASEIRKRLGFHPAWWPTTKFDVGMVGQFHDGVFHPETTLDRLDYHHGVVEDASRSSYEHSSKDAVAVAVKLAGQAPAEGSMLGVAEAGLHVCFSSEHAALMQAEGCRTRRLGDIASLGLELLIRYRVGRWDKRWCVVTEVQAAERATVIIAESDDAFIELACGGVIPTGAATLTDADASLEIRRSHKLGFKSVGTRGLTPLMRIYGLRWGLLSGNRFKPRHMLPDDPDGDDEPAFVELGPDDELDDLSSGSGR